MGEYKIWIDDARIIRGEIIGEHTKADAENVIYEINTLLKEKEIKKLLIDMSRTGRPDSEARRLHAHNIKTNPNFTKAALFGASTINRVMANFIIKASGIGGNRVRYFANEADAINWLKEK